MRWRKADGRETNTKAEMGSNSSRNTKEPDEDEGKEEKLGEWEVEREARVHGRGIKYK